LASPRKNKGRGADGNVLHRFQRLHVEPEGEQHDSVSTSTQVHLETAKKIISRNASPDIPFNQSINPYRGCEHGCAYCYARANHAYLELSPGLDFETILYAKQNCAQLLREELSAKNYQCQTISLGNITDAYQPVEREMRLTRSLIELLAKAKHPLSIVTKSALILRDMDLLSAMAKDDLVHIAISLTSLDHDLSRKMEPRAASPQRRLEVIEKLVDAGIPVSVLLAPIIPSINDHEIEKIIAAVKQAGAASINYLVLRLPHEVKDVFQDWLQNYYPDRYAKVINKLHSLFDGQVYRAGFGKRMRGQGEYAALINSRFKLACKKTDLSNVFIETRTDLFAPHLLHENQLNLF
jgi:DNA repair photolyase